MDAMRVAVAKSATLVEAARMGPMALVAETAVAHFNHTETLRGQQDQQQCSCACGACRHHHDDADGGDKTFLTSAPLPVEAPAASEGVSLQSAGGTGRPAGVGEAAKVADGTVSAPAVATTALTGFMLREYAHHTRRVQAALAALDETHQPSQLPTPPPSNSKADAAKTARPGRAATAATAATAAAAMGLGVTPGQIAASIATSAAAATARAATVGWGATGRVPQPPTSAAHASSSLFAGLANPSSANGSGWAVGDATRSGVHGSRRNSTGERHAEAAASAVRVDELEAETLARIQQAEVAKRRRVAAAMT
jgi:hypothetical protein